VEVIVVIYAGSLVYLARKNSREDLTSTTPVPLEPTASVIVDMDDEPPAEIDFDSGIEAGRKALEVQRPSKED
jgi:hypothetical protein